MSQQQSEETRRSSTGAKHAQETLNSWREKQKDVRSSEFSPSPPFDIVTQEWYRQKDLLTVIHHGWNRVRRTSGRCSTGVERECVRRCNVSPHRWPTRCQHGATQWSPLRHYYTTGPCNEGLTGKRISGFQLHISNHLIISLMGRVYWTCRNENSSQLREYMSTFITWYGFFFLMNYLLDRI